MNARFASHVTIGIKLAALLALTAAYTRGLPTTVQGLDTGELVAGAYNFTVVHPPGYPVYVCLQFLATHIPLGDSVFWRAALCTTLLAMGVLGLLSFVGDVTLVAFVALVAPLALEGMFWRYALLPDVFMLHATFTVSLLLLTLYAPASTRRTWLLAILWGAGLANHQTLTLLAPLVLYAMWQGTSPKAFAGALAGATLTCAFLYGLLFAMHPDSVASWGGIHDASDWWRHVLRREYGTLRLARKDEGGGGIANIVAFGSLILSMPVTLVVAFLGPVWLHKRLGVDFWVAWGTTVVTSAAFLVVANVGEGPILQRFFLMPMVALTTLALYLARMLGNQLPRSAKLLVPGCALIVSVWHAVGDMPARDLSRETIVEDYAQNLLRMTSTTPNVLLFAEGDSVINALRYVQNVQDIRPDIPVISTTGIPAWHLSQIKRMQPDLLLPISAEQGIDGEHLVTNLISPNESKFTIIANATHGLNLTGHRVTYLGLGKRVQPGEGMDANQSTIDAIEVRSTPSRYGVTDEAIEPKVLFAAYALGDLVAGKLARDAAIKRHHFKRALEHVPYCWPALYELCRLDARPDADCRAAALSLRTSDANYF